MPVTVLGLGSNVLVRDGGIRGAVVLLHNPGAALAVADGARLRRRRRREPEARALRGDARLRRRGVPRRHSGHRRRRAGDERRLLRRRDVDATSRASKRCRATARSTCARRPTTRSAIAACTRRDGRALDELFTAAWFRFPQGDVATGARAHQGAARAGASRRSRSRCRTPAACFAIRPAITRRG